MGRTKSKTSQEGKEEKEEKKSRWSRLVEKIRAGIKSFQEYREREAKNYAKMREWYKSNLERYVEGYLSLFTLPPPQPARRGKKRKTSTPSLGLAEFDIGADILGTPGYSGEEIGGGLSGFDIGLDILGTPGMGGSLEFGGEVGMGRRRSRRKKRRGRKRRKRRR